jgi:hypothetical protein
LTVIGPVRGQGANVKPKRNNKYAQKMEPPWSPENYEQKGKLCNPLIILVGARRF